MYLSTYLPSFNVWSFLVLSIHPLLPPSQIIIIIIIANHKDAKMTPNNSSHPYTSMRGDRMIYN